MKTISILAILAVLAGFAAAAACPGTITAPLTLSDDLVATGGTSCVNIAAGVTLDCAGHSISGTAISGVLFSLGVNGATVRNCDIHGFTYGVSLGSIGSGGGDSIVSNTIHDNRKYDIYINSGHNNNVVAHNVLYNAAWLVRTGGSGSLIYDNAFGAATYGPIDNAGSNTWNVAETPGTNIIGGPNLGGNSWAGYTGCDADADGIGETAYSPVAGMTDYLPLTNVAC